ncbi:hypothetical protein H1C71_031952 [Ictidomys tridecemlineatus]|nr:hypothetical protein H1C71_031952 [Ictidomys tridecemlineatus]
MHTIRRKTFLSGSCLKEERGWRPRGSVSVSATPAENKQPSGREWGSGVGEVAALLLRAVIWAFEAMIPGEIPIPVNKGITNVIIGEKHEPELRDFATPLPTYHLHRLVE